MKQKQHPRAGRFQRLHALLTGALHPPLPVHSRASNHIRTDIGLPRLYQPERTQNRLWIIPVDPDRSFIQHEFVKENEG